MTPLFNKILLLALLLAGGSVHAAGLINLLEGNVSVTNKNGELRIPARGERVEVGDKITTGRDGEIHIITDDSGLLALRPNTTLNIDAYRADGGSDDNVALKLMRGTFRSITGWIGKTWPKNYSVRTAHAAIGIRGTDHEPLVVEDGLDAGTYDKVNAGRTLLDTPFGKIEIGPKQAGFMPKDASQPPKVLAQIPALFKPAKNEAAIEKTKAILEPAADEKLKTKQRDNMRKGAGADGKPKIGDMEAGRKAAAALDEVLRAYETGNTAFIRNRLDPAMIGYQRLLDGIAVEANQCKQMRLRLLDTQIQAGPDLVVIQTAWEKRCVQLPNFTPRLDSGRSTFLMHLGAGGWSVAAISGSNPLASTGVLAAMSASTPLDCAAVNNLANVGGPLPASAQSFTITVTDPDMTGASSITVQVKSGNDVESIIVPASVPGTFQRTTLLVKKGAASPGNGVIDILPVGGGVLGPLACPAVTISYVDTTVISGSQTISVTVPIP